jgi:hypothetical protein
MNTLMKNTAGMMVDMAIRGIVSNSVAMEKSVALAYMSSGLM